MTKRRSMMRAFTGGSVRAYDPQRKQWDRHDALVVDGPDVVSLDANAIGSGVRRVDLAGATILPAFADCHVHLTDSGLKSGDRDFSDVRDAATFAARVAALPRTRFVIAGNYDDGGWTDGAVAATLDATHRDCVAMLVRVDGHSALLSRAALAFADLDPALPGIERDAAGTPTGRLFLAANRCAQVAIIAALPHAEKRAADIRAATAALAQGALHLHVQLVGLGDVAAYAAEIRSLPAAGAAKWYPKVCERDPGIAHALGLSFVGGDIFLDGSIGSGTAAVSEPYCNGGGTGVLMHTDAEVEAYFSAAERLGLSAGVHAIGDRAIEQCLTAWERVLNGRPSPTGRHFIEHFEIARADHIERSARLGMYLSMQPQFDAAWGGPDGMYERRLGSGRARSMNRLKTALRAGAVLAGGTDSPVCRLSPLAGMQAALDHFTPAERLDAGEALRMYTYDAARFGHAEHRTGSLAPGSAADFVIVDGDPLAGGSFGGLRVRETWSDGIRVYPP